MAQPPNLITNRIVYITIMYGDITTDIGTIPCPNCRCKRPLQPGTTLTPQMIRAPPQRGEESPAEDGWLEIQEVSWHHGERLIVIRQRIAQRPESGGKLLLEVPGYRFQALVTDLPDSVLPLQVWRRYNGRADSENRLKELGRQFGVRGLCCQQFWATEAAHLLAILSHNLCVLLLRDLGKLEKIELATLRMRLFLRAGVWSKAQGRSTLRLAIPPAWRTWWCEIIEKLKSPFPPQNIFCNAVENLCS